MKTKQKAKKRFIAVDDLCKLNIVTSAAISPDEKKIAYTVQTVSEDKRKYFARIFTADIKSGETRQFTFGEVSDRELTWSRDGKQIAFVSTRNKKTGIYVIPSEGGAERKIMEADGAFLSLSWTPDGREIVFVFRYNDSHDIKDEKKKKEAPLYRHITRLYYRLDASGFLPKDRFHIWKVCVDDGKTTQLTKGKYDELYPAVSPNGKYIAFVSNRSKNPDLHVEQDDIFLIPVNGGKAKKVPTPTGPVARPGFSPDSRRIAYFGHANPVNRGWITNYHLWMVGVNGKPAARDLIPKFDRQLYDQTIGDMGEGFDIQPAQWTPDGKRIYFCASDRGSTHIFYVPATGGLPTRVTENDCHVTCCSMNGRKKQVAAVISNLKNPAELFCMPAVYNGDAKSRRLTHSNRNLFAEIKLPGIREIRFKAYDGTSLQGFLVTPPNMNKNRKYPAILEIHGGPQAQYGFTFFHEMLFLASKGYVILYTNPRGGGGRGETFAGSIVADWGSIDYMDCMAATDYLEKLPYVNKNRLGVTGGSYGGFMTNWIVGHTDRFKAAVTQRSVVDLHSFFGSSDFGYLFEKEFDGYPWTNPEIYKKCSPLTHVKNIKTPLLIIHSEQDLRCGIEQAERLFATLKILRRKVEFIRFPEEPHGLSRHGRPDRRVARLEWIVKWFDRYLK